MDPAEIRQKVVKIIADQLNKPEVDCVDEARFIEDLGGDSLDAVEAIMEIEDNLDIAIPDQEAKELTTVGALINYAIAKKAA